MTVCAPNFTLGNLGFESGYGARQLITHAPALTFQWLDVVELQYFDVRFSAVNTWMRNQPIIDICLVSVLSYTIILLCFIYVLLPVFQVMTAAILRQAAIAVIVSVPGLFVP